MIKSIPKFLPQKVGKYLHFWVIVLSLTFNSCKENELLFSQIDTSTIRFSEVAITSLEVKENEIYLTVPYGTNLQSLTPDFNLTLDGEVIPALGKAYNFSKPVYFTVVHSTGGKQIYTFYVTTDDQPAPEITSISATEIEAGQTFQLKGHYFGNYSLGIKVALVNENQLTAALPHQLKDSTTLVVTVPDSVATGNYQVALQVKDKNTLSSQKIKIAYPTPLIFEIKGKYALDGDTVRLTGKYLDLKQNQFTVSLLNKSNSVETKVLSTQSSTEELKVIIPKETLPSTYSLQINNKTTQKVSKELGEALVVYSSQRPFVNGIVGGKTTIKAGESIEFTTQNFEKESIRFYQVQLEGTTSQITLNGIYDAASKQLKIELPSQLTKGSYQLRFLLSNPSENYYYSFRINTQLEAN